MWLHFLKHFYNYIIIYLLHKQNVLLAGMHIKNISLKNALKILMTPPVLHRFLTNQMLSRNENVPFPTPPTFN